MSKDGILEQFEGPLPTSAGQAFPGQRAVFGGLDLHSSFKDANWIELYIYGISGKRLTPAQLTVLQSLWVYTSYPDARLWCNRVGALTASSRGTGAQALAAGIVASEAGLYGFGPESAIADFLVRAKAATAAGANLEQLVREELRLQRHLMGFGRPMAADFVDERIPVTLAKMQREGVPVGPHLQLAFDIEDALARVTGKRLPMTYATVLVAVPLDFGLSKLEAYLYLLPSFVGGMLPCYVEALARPAGATFALRCERIDYDGVPPRQWD
jgi:citrate synthase